jgi:hypothetical protein
MSYNGIRTRPMTVPCAPRRLDDEVLAPSTHCSSIADIAVLPHLAGRRAAARAHLYGRISMPKYVDPKKRILNCVPSQKTEEDWGLAQALQSETVAAPGPLPTSVDLRAPWWEVGDQLQTGLVRRLGGGRLAGALAPGQAGPDRADRPPGRALRLDGGKGDRRVHLATHDLHRATPPCAWSTAARRRSAAAPHRPLRSAWRWNPVRRRSWTIPP